MLPKIEAQYDLSRVLLAYDDLREQYRDQAASRALNRTATTVRAEAARMIGHDYNMKISAAKGQMEIRRATKNDLRAAVQVSGRPIPLIEFDARQVRAGVSVKVKGTRKVVSHAFIATMKTGHKGVYVRIGPPGDLAPRLPIKQLYSLSLPVAFTQKQIVDALLTVATERFAETMAQEVRFIQLKAA